MAAPGFTPVPSEPQPQSLSFALLLWRGLRLAHLVNTKWRWLEQGSIESPTVLRTHASQGRTNYLHWFSWFWDILNSGVYVHVCVVFRSGGREADYSYKVSLWFNYFFQEISPEGLCFKYYFCSFIFLSLWYSHYAYVTPFVIVPHFLDILFFFK